MKAPNKMMIAVGALALTATTLLAGCGGSSSGATDAAEPAPVEAPASAWEGTVKPADVADEAWATGLAKGEDQAAQYLAGLTPEQLAQACEEGGASADKIAAEAQGASAIGGTVEEWTQVFETVYANTALMACSMAE